MIAPPRLAATLFSFTNELLAAERPPDALLAELLETAPGVAVEIDGAQHFRSFPLLDPEEVGRTAAVVHAARGRISLLGGGADVAPGPGRLLDADGQVEHLRAQITAAAMLGADGLRIPFGVVPWTVLERVADQARATGVLLLEEVQGPADPGGPPILARIEDLERTGDTTVRLLLDTSALMGGLPGTYASALRAERVPDALVERLGQALADGRVAPIVLPALADPAITPAGHALLLTAMTRFGSTRADEWSSLAPWIAAVHVKWWDLGSAAADLDGEAGAVLEGLLSAGFDGTVCSEWGGHEWMGLGTRAADQVAAHLALLRDRFRTRTDDFSTKTT